MPLFINHDISPFLFFNYNPFIRSTIFPWGSTKNSGTVHPIPFDEIQLCKNKKKIQAYLDPNIEASTFNTFCKCFRLSPFFTCNNPLPFTLLIHNSNEQSCMSSCLHMPAVNSISSSISFRKETPLLFCKLR